HEYGAMARQAAGCRLDPIAIDGQLRQRVLRVEDAKDLRAVGARDVPRCAVRSDRWGLEIRRCGARPRHGHLEAGRRRGHDLDPRRTDRLLDPPPGPVVAVHADAWFTHAARRQLEPERLRLAKPGLDGEM